MEILLQGLGKKFNQDWIFKNVSVEFVSGISNAIIGPNGSGKSTLLKIISGFLLPTEGNIGYVREGKSINSEEYYKFIDFPAPYLELIDEMTLEEFLQFHFQFKDLNKDIDIATLPEMMFLDKDQKKYIGNFSSGMKQRLKIGLGIFSDSPVLLLDEPTTNLDNDSKNWFKDSFNKIKKEKLIILASNESEDIDLCDKKINLLNFK
ncbi:ATP-binding cassette domain-containing protein [Bacteroidota bacterium]